MSKFNNPVSIFTESEGVKLLANKLKKDIQSVDRILVITRGDNVHKNFHLQPILPVIEKKEYYVKEITISNPDLLDILDINQEIQNFDFEFIIAIGGGSVLDMAKILSAVKSAPISDVNDLRNFIVNNEYKDKKEMTPWIGIPTTSGTGSEVTSWATVWDKELGKKYSVTDERLYARACLVLPELTISLPLELSVSTGLDALCHATEAYWSVHTNPVTRIYALEAIRLIRSNLTRLKENPESTNIREQLAKGSLYAGLAFSNTRTTACHSISYPLTLLHGINHGLAASLTLGAMLQINESQIVEVEKLLEAYDVQHSNEVETFVFNIYKEFGLSYKLREYGVDMDNVQHIVKASYTKGRIDNNPVELSEEMITEIIVSLI